MHLLAKRSHHLPPILSRRFFIFPTSRHHQPFRTYAALPQRQRNAPESTASPKSTPSPSSSPIPLKSVLPTQSPKSRINPPASTLPPPLKLPARTLENGQELVWYRYYFRLGRAYGGFYMAGLKAIWGNYKSIRGLMKGLPSQNIGTIRQAVREGTLSRADFQSIRRSKRDMAKLVPFILMWCVCGEFTPLVVIFITGLVPRTLWIPKQVQKAREESEERRRNLKRKSDFGESSIITIIQQHLSSSSGTTLRSAHQYLAQSLQLCPAWWDRLAPSLVPSGLVQRRVEDRLKDLDVDDFAIGRDGGVRKMNGEEVFMACEDRGIDVLGKDEGCLRQELERWLRHHMVKSSTTREVP